MKKLILAALALLGAGFATASPAMAQDARDESGVYVGVGVATADVPYEFRDGSGTPSIDLSGSLPTVSVGYILELDGGWTVVFGAEAAMGEFEKCVRDGNAIVQCLRLLGIYTAEVQAGYEWRNGFGINASIGYQQILLEYEQSCGVGAAYTSGHCRNAGGASGYRRQAEDTLEGLIAGIGAQYRFGPRLVIQGGVRYQRQDERENDYNGPNGVGGALNPVAPAETEAYTFHLSLRRSF